MANPYFQFKQFIIYQECCAMKVTTDACVFGAWSAKELQKLSPERQIHVLDIGTGTGILSLMLAQKNQVCIHAVEIDHEASDQAERNFKNSPWKKNIFIHHKDIHLFNPQKKFDCIISNPPFYEKEISSSSTKKNTAHHSAALRMQDLFQIIHKNLKVDGIFFLLLPSKRERELDGEMQKEGLFLRDKIYLRQSVRHSPFRIIAAGSQKFTSVTTSELSIWNEQQQYTAEFRELLKDYYLYL
ncbi:MAG: tRNA1(Val) (adenine(37)-N6)-methyltransferase [Flavisolibacter sp.]